MCFGSLAPRFHQCCSVIYIMIRANPGCQKKKKMLWFYAHFQLPGFFNLTTQKVYPWDSLRLPGSRKSWAKGEHCSSPASKRRCAEDPSSILSQPPPQNSQRIRHARQEDSPRDGQTVGQASEVLRGAAFSEGAHQPSVQKRYEVTSHIPD